MNNEEEKPWYKKLSWIVGIIACFFVIGSFVFYWIHLPDPHNANNKDVIGISGTFGDSFGFLTCLFSGLSSIGMIVAILMQREELQLQRKELEDNRAVFIDQKAAQENSVKLSALMIIFQEDEKMIKHYNHITSEYDELDSKGIVWKTEMEHDDSLYDLTLKYREALKVNPILKDRHKTILSEIEKIIIESGVNLPQLPK